MTVAQIKAVQMKFCGITRAEDAEAAIASGAALLGLNFYPGSPRHITLEHAQQIADVVAGRARLVGVFVNMNLAGVRQIARAVPLDCIQLHGDELREECTELAGDFEVIRAIKVTPQFRPEDLAAYSCCRGLLLDAPSPQHGGSGHSFDWRSVDWSAVREAAPWATLFLAGGLTAENIAEAIRIARPDVVDVASGIEESKGIKSAEKMRAFAEAVLAAGREVR
jgi:phosphoribosylanthranilate isomerase